MAGLLSPRRLCGGARAPLLGRRGPSGLRWARARGRPLALFRVLRPRGWSGPASIRIPAAARLCGLLALGDDPARLVGLVVSVCACFAHRCRGRFGAGIAVVARLAGRPMPRACRRLVLGPLQLSPSRAGGPGALAGWRGLAGAGRAAVPGRGLRVGGVRPPQKGRSGPLRGAPGRSSSACPRAALFSSLLGRPVGAVVFANAALLGPVSGSFRRAPRLPIAPR